MTITDKEYGDKGMRLNFEVLTVAQLRRVIEKCGKNHKGLSKRQMINLCNALVGQ